MRLFLDQSGRLLFIVLLFLTVFSYAMFQGGFVSWFIFYVTLPFILYAFIAFFVLERITQVERKWESTRTFAGEEIKMAVKLKRRTFFPFAYMTVKEILDDEKLLANQENNMSMLKIAGTRRQFEWRYKLSGIQRGAYHLNKLEVTFHDFFGWVNKKIVVEKSQTFFIYPKVHEVSNLHIQSLFQNGYVFSKRSLEKDASVVTGVRNYQSGDRFSWINWKAFAKSNELHTKEFEDRKSQGMLVLLDCSGASYFDDAVELAASITNALVKKREEISLLSTSEGGTYFSQIQSGAAFDKVMDYLATVEADQSQDFLAFLMQKQVILQTAATLVITTNLTEEKLFALSKMMKQCVCVLIVDSLEKVEVNRPMLPNLKVKIVQRGHYDQLFTEER